MRLTAYTDYALRTLIYLAARRDRLVTIQDIAVHHGISKNHLTKVVHRLGLAGMLRTVRGRHGGIALGREPADISIGTVVRGTEPDFCMAPCFAGHSGACPYAGHCGLQGLLAKATQGWLAELDGATLADVLAASQTSHFELVRSPDCTGTLHPPANGRDHAGHVR